MAKSRGKQNLPLILFGLIFAGIGAGFLFISVIPTLHDWQQMKSWQAVEAELLAANLVTNHSSDSTTYSATASYRYQYNGRMFSSSRVAINSGSDNIGDFQYHLGRRLERDLQEKRAIQIWVDPDNPGNAVINRDLRLGLLGFKLIFVLVFGGFGLGVLFYSKMARPAQDWQAPEYRDRPWLAVPAWETGTIRSNAKIIHWVLWGIAVIWNLISCPVLFVLPRELERGNYPALFALLFPLVGIGLLIGAMIQTRRWRRFGPTPFTMDPFPGRLGGRVGGNLEIKLPYNPNHRFDIRLTCAYSYVSGSGKNRSRREKVLWQDKQTVTPQPGRYGTRLDIAFDVPPTLPASEQQCSAYHKWSLDVEGKLDGPDYSRQFEIPVFPAENPSAPLSGAKTRFEPIESIPEHGADIGASAVEKLLGIHHHHDGAQWRYPAGRNTKLGIMLIIFGFIFLGAAVFLAQAAIRDFNAGSGPGLGFGIVFNSIGIFMTSVFGLIGVGMALGGVYSMANSLTLVLQDDLLHSQRRLFGIPISYTALPVTTITTIDKKLTSSTSSGSKHRVFYKVYAQAGSRKKFTLAENLDSASAADAVVDYFKNRFRIKELG